MNDEQPREQQRDTIASSFGEILELLCRQHENIEAAIFFDREGETIDYYSLMDPYETRLTAAHMGLIFESARMRLAWLGMGKVDLVEVRNTELHSITLYVGEGSMLAVITGPDGIDDDIQASLIKTVMLLREEACY